MAAATGVITIEADDPEQAQTDQSEQAQKQIEDQDEGESAPPLLHPDPSRLISCVRAPCLKKQNTSGSTSPTLSHSPPAQVYSFTGFTTLCSATPKRQVHFDAAPPEAGLTHSGDRYDRRPIECTQGGSQNDLSLPPRGTCTLYTGEADDEACEEEDESEECKAKRLQGFAKWSRLKNGASLLGASNSFKTYLSSKKENEEQDSNACSTPVHGIRSFGKLAGQSGLASPERVSSHVNEDADEKESLSYDDLADGNASASCDDESDGEGRHEAFRKAVYAALSKDPNATPMPSPSVRPRWECVTSYFDPSSEGETAAQENVEDLPSLEQAELSADTPLPKEQEDCKVTTWTQNQADIGETTIPLTIKSVIGQLRSSAKCSPSLSLDGSSLTHRSSSPMSSRGSSDAWGSENGGGGHWSGSEHDAFDAAFGKGLTPTGLKRSNERSNSGSKSSKSASFDDTAASEVQEVPILTKEPLSLSNDSEHHDAEHTSSSSSGGGPGWMSSCCTSPEMTAMDGDYMTMPGATSSQLGSPQEKMIPMSSVQHLSPLLMERRHSIDSKVDAENGPLLRRSSKLLYQLSDHGISSEGNSPQVLSCDEDEVAKKPSCLFRCPKKSRKPRRTASSGDGKREEDCSDKPNRAVMPRSKSASATRTHLRKESAFHDQLDDEGALGGF
jgi:hypothetical protein